MSHRLHHYHSPRELTILIIVVWVIEVAVVVGSLLWVSYQSDALSRQSIRAAHASVQTAVSVSNNTFSAEGSSQADKVAALGVLQVTLDDLEQQICPGIDISRYVIFSNQGKACREAKTAVMELRDALSDARGYGSDDRELAAAFDVKATAETNQAQYERWSAIVDQIGTADVSDGLSARKDELRSLAADHRDAWKAVIDADSAKDATGFETAAQRVESTLTLLKKVPENSTKTYDERTAAFTSKLAAFYSATNL